jgi:gluconate 2-dehydrogenase gamma chain
VRFTLSAHDRAVLDAVADRLIPADDTGPGAREARVIDYIERSLADAYEDHRDAYTTGLAALGGAGFGELPPSRQYAILAELERQGDAFFELVRRHAIEGMFGDPAWGGNADRIGWDLLGYPGPRHVWTEAEQELEVEHRVEGQR